MLAQIGDVLPRFRIYQTLFKNHERPLVASSKAYLDVLEFCVRTKNFFLHARTSRCLFSHPTQLTHGAYKEAVPLSIVLRSAWKPFNEEFSECMQNFRKHTKQVEKESRLAHLIESARSHKIELAIRALLIRSEKLRRRHRVLGILPAVNYMEKHTILSNARHRDTTNWVRIIPQYVSKQSAVAPECVCCYGIPDSGKSVIVASVVDHLLSTQPPGCLVCYYYCDYTDTASLEPIRLVASLVKQVFERLPLDHFNDDFQSPFDKGKPVPLRIAGWKYFMELLQGYNNVYMILDGIHELEKDCQATLLSLITLLLGKTNIVAKIYLNSCLEECRINRAMKSHGTFQLSAHKQCPTFLHS